MRRAHALKRPKGKTMGRNFIFVDTETRNEDGVVESGNHSLFFGVAIHTIFRTSKSTKSARMDRKYFEKADVFWKWAVSKITAKESLWVLAHNWNYDAAILSTETLLSEMGFECTLYINEKPPVIVRWRDSKRRTILMIDTLNYFRTSVDDLGRSIGHRKYDMPEDNATLDEWKKYAWRDVEIIRGAFLQFRKFVLDHNLGTLQNTLASQAFASYRYRFMPKDIQIMVHDRQRFLRMDREAYHGGRTESFYRGDPMETVYKLDVNSQYPAIMRDNDFPYEPVKFYGRSKHPLPRDIEAAIYDGYAVTARVFLNTDSEAYPVKHNGKLIFPVGSFETVLTTPELRYALRHDHIQRVLSYVTYKRTNLFRKYVDYFYNERKRFQEDNNHAFQYLCKIMMNSLYGKFGQNGRKWMPYQSLPKGTGFHRDYFTGQVLRVRNMMGQTQTLSKEPESENSIPNIAAEITAHGRIQIWEFCEIAGMVYYCDTDSIITNRKGLENLLDYLDNRRLGFLKLEGTFEESYFYAPKHYRLGDELTLKGVKKNAVSLGGGRYRQEKFNSWDTLSKKELDGFVPIERVEKMISGENTKRIVRGENAWTEPIRIAGGVQESRLI